jgi:hypothetical protein
MRRQAGSRRRITLNYSRELVRIVLLICLLGSVAAFAATREKPSLAITPAQSAAAELSIEQPVVLSAGIESTSLANLSESTTFRLLWIAAGFGLILVLRRQRRKA